MVELNIATKNRRKMRQYYDNFLCNIFENLVSNFDNKEYVLIEEINRICNRRVVLSFILNFNALNNRNDNDLMNFISQLKVLINGI